MYAVYHSERIGIRQATLRSVSVGSGNTTFVSTILLHIVITSVVKQKYDIYVDYCIVM